MGRLRKVGSAIGVLVVIAGCSSGGTGYTGSATNSVPSVSSAAAEVALPHSGAPKVGKPLSVSAFEQDPCAVMSATQLRSIRVSVSDVNPDAENATGPNCNWVMGPGFGSFGGAILTSNDEGLSSLYAKNAAGELGFFEKIADVGGYPGVAYDIVDDRDSGACNVEIGVSDELTYYIGVNAGRKSPFKSKPCDLAEKLAALAVETMKG